MRKSANPKKANLPKDDYAKLARSQGIDALFRQRAIWSHLGWRDLRSRYSRTKIGPWWSAAGLAVSVLGMSFAVGVLGSGSVNEVAPRVAVGLALWTMVSANLNEAVSCFNGERGLLLNTGVSETTLIVRQVWRNGLIFLHNLIVVVIVFVITGVSIPRLFASLMFLPLVFVCLIGTSFLAAYLGTRYPDLEQFIPSLINFVFFMTPILWDAPNEGLGQLVVVVNPFAWIIVAFTDLILESEINQVVVLCLICWTIVSVVVIEIGQRNSREVRRLL